MRSAIAFDMSNLLNSLKVSEDHKAFAHGQLRRAASRTIREFGYEWASIPPNLTAEERFNLFSLRASLKKTIFTSTKGWHSNQSMVWKRFRGYAQKVGARHEALRLITKIRNEISK